MAHSKFHILYSDIGGVLGTNGWDTNLRHRIAEHFGMNPHEIESRHALTFDTYERGFMSFEQYLTYVFFSSPRPFTLEQIREYAYDASTAWPENIEFYRTVKAANSLKLALISNEGTGLTEHRTRKFGLRNLADFMVFSYATHMRKPDSDIWHLALKLAQASVEESIYVDDRKLFVDIAADHGFTAIHYTSLPELREAFKKLHLAVT